LQPKNRKDVLPLKAPKNSAQSVSVEKLLKEKVLEEYKLKKMENEKETYQAAEDTVSTCAYC
jgi:hypothetical protein